VRIALAVMCAALLASCRPAAGPSTLRIDPALATLVPAGSQLLVGAKLEKLRETQTYQKHFAQMPIPQLDRFASETGLDPRKDVWEVLFCSNGKDNGVLMVRGKFAPADMEPKLERRGATRFAYKGYTLFGDERSAVFFMTPSTALAGSTPVLKTIIDNRDHSGAGVPASLQPLVNAVPSDAQFWAAFNGVLVNMPFPETSNLGNINIMIRSLQSGWVSADLRPGLALKAVGNCASDSGAKQIHDALRGLVGLGRLSTPDNRPDLLRAYDDIRIDQQGKQVNVTVNVPQDLVDKVLDALVTSSQRGSRRPDSSSPRPR
jgi:hypothetical protein